MTPEEREALLARNPGLALAISRGVKSLDESLATVRAIGGGTNAATIGTPDLRGPETPPPPSDPYDPADPLWNADPGASSVTFSSPVGFSNLWRMEREYALQHCTPDGFPFDTSTIPQGLNRLLTQDEADILNARYGAQP